MSECFDYQDVVDTSGKPILKRQCFCGTTACREPASIQSQVCSLSGQPLKKHLNHYHCTDPHCWAEYCEPKEQS